MAGNAGPHGYERVSARVCCVPAVRQHPFPVILLDEIEKAHPKVFEALSLEAIREICVLQAMNGHVPVARM